MDITPFYSSSKKTARCLKCRHIDLERRALASVSAQPRNRRREDDPAGIESAWLYTVL